MQLYRFIKIHRFNRIINSTVCRTLCLVWLRIWVLWSRDIVLLLGVVIQCRAPYVSSGRVVGNSVEVGFFYPAWGVPVPKKNALCIRNL
jgi:hypothetical protein